MCRNTLVVFFPHGHKASLLGWICPSRHRGSRPQSVETSTAVDGARFLTQEPAYSSFMMAAALLIGRLATVGIGYGWRLGFGE